MVTTGEFPAASIEQGDAAGPRAHGGPAEISAGAHFPALDGYRAVAALMVVVTHVAYTTGAVVTGTFGHLVGRFDFGVPLFFLMSGFLLYRPWVRASLEGRARPGLGRYAVRRAARILPLYWVVAVFTLLLLPEIQPVARGQWWVHLLGLQIYQPQGAIEGLSQTWSLCTEISFYVALPFFGMLALGRMRTSVDRATRRQAVVLCALVLVALGYQVMKVWTNLLPVQAGYWLPFYLDWFAAGMGLALIEVRARLPHPPAPVRAAVAVASDPWVSLVIAGALFAVAVTPIGGSYDFTPTAPWESMIKHWLYLWCAFFLLLPGLVGGRGWTRQLTRTIPRRIGLISYGVFLWHLVLLRMLMPALHIPFFSGRGALVLALLLPLTLLVATVTYRLVERPAQRWAHRF